MSSYVINSPHLLDDKRVEFILTEAGLGLGCTFKDALFVKKLMKDLKINVPIKKTEIKPYRCFYYSEYPSKKEHWQDRWSICWKVIIHAEKKIKWDPASNEIKTEALGTKKIPRPADTENVGCLIISDFIDLKKIEAVKKAIVNDAKLQEEQSKLKVGKPVISETWTQSIRKKKFHQLILDVGSFDSKYYEAGPKYSERFMKICEDHKGLTHFYHLMK